MADEGNKSPMAFASRLAELSTAKVKERRARFAEYVKTATNEYITNLEATIADHEKALEDRYREFKQEEEQLNEGIVESWQAIGEIYAQLQRGHKKLAEHIHPIRADTLARAEESLKVIDLLCQEEERIIQGCYDCANGIGTSNGKGGGGKGQRRNPKNGKENNSGSGSGTSGKQSAGR